MVFDQQKTLININTLVNLKQAERYKGLKP